MRKRRHRSGGDECMDHRSAETLVEAGCAERCPVKVVYGIGKVQPVSFLNGTQCRGAVSDKPMEIMARNALPLSSQWIIDGLGLCRPLYASTAEYVYVGPQDLTLPWERADQMRTLS